jgi:hypothetical protein
LQYAYPESIALSLTGNAQKVLGPGVMVEINNPITFDQLTSVYGSGLYINATVNGPASTYIINICNLSDPNNIIKTLTGTVNKGAINDFWDLTEGNGNGLPNGDLLATFHLSSSANGNAGAGAGGGSGSVAAAEAAGPQHIFQQEPAQLNDANFVFAYGCDVGLSTESDYNNMQSAMIFNIVNTLCYPGYNLSGYSSYNELLPFFANEWDAFAFGCFTKADDKLLLDSLPSGDNFLFIGHGYADCISSANQVIMKDYDIANVLGYGPHSSQNGYPTRHPYRLVFLDGCETFSPGLAKAFGCPFSATTVWTTSNFNAIGRAPRAFVGMTKRENMPSVGTGSLGWTIWTSAHKMFLDSWMAHNPLNECMSEYRMGMLYNGILNTDFPRRGKEWKITGCVDLVRRDPDGY